MSKQDAQKDRPARPQRAKRRGVPLWYVEPLSEARTMLADFFSILLAGSRLNRKACLEPGVHAAGDVIDMAVAQVCQRFCGNVAAMA